MNRQVLYRGRDFKGEWYQGYFTRHRNIQNKVYTAIHLYDEVEGDTYCDGLRAVDEMTVGLYTGLEDANGTKIFEGDIVQAPSNLAGTEFYIGTIEFGNFNDYNGNTYTGFYIKWHNVPEYSTLRQSIIWWRDEQDRFLKVIGNKWDNPEVLKSE